MVKLNLLTQWGGYICKGRHIYFNKTFVLHTFRVWMVWLFWQNIDNIFMVQFSEKANIILKHCLVLKWSIRFDILWGGMGGGETNFNISEGGINLNKTIEGINFVKVRSRNIFSYNKLRSCLNHLLICLIGWYI